MSNHMFKGPFMQPAGAMYPYPAPPMPYPHHPSGFCASCCHPIAKCVCHRDCKKIQKELLCQPDTAVKPGTTDATGTLSQAGKTADQSQLKLFAMMDLTSPAGTAADSQATDSEATIVLNNVQRLRQLATQRAVAMGVQTAIIGGGCCVHLSIEYMPLSPLADMVSFSGAMVIDSDATVMLWGKYFNGDGYHVKECVISTNPGAHLWVASINSVTRVRWCEIISC